MAFPKVFVTRQIGDDALSRLDKELDLKVWEDYFPPSREQLLVATKDSVGILTMLTDQIDGSFLSQRRSLKVVSNMATGVDNVDVDAASMNQVLVGSTPGVLTDTCAEFVLALLLASARRLAEGEHAIRDGSWKVWHPSFLLGRDLNQSTLGIIGLGNIGLQVAIRAKAFGMKTVYFQRTRNHDLEAQYGIEFVPSLGALLGLADFVSIHVPLTEQTYHLIGQKELDGMKKTGVLINTSRGPVVDQKALLASLKNEVIAGAALDVFETEPINPSDPLLKLPNVVATPHIGSASIATRTKMAIMAAENLRCGVLGLPMPHCVNLKRLSG